MAESSMHNLLETDVSSLQTKLDSLCIADETCWTCFCNFAMLIKTCTFTLIGLTTVDKAVIVSNETELTKTR